MNYFRKFIEKHWSQIQKRISENTISDWESEDDFLSNEIKSLFKLINKDKYEKMRKQSFTNALISEYREYRFDYFNDLLKKSKNKIKRKVYRIPFISLW